MSWPVDVTDYVLGELSDDDRLVADRLMRDDPAFRAEVERMRPLVAGLAALPAEGWEAPVPPPLAPPPPVAAAPAPARERRPRRLVLRPLAAGLAAAALLAVGVGAGALLTHDSGGATTDGARVALQPLTDAPAAGRAVAVVDRRDGRLTLDVTGMAPSRPGEFYELWLLNSPTDLVSVASFRVPSSGTTEVTVPVPTDPTRFRFLDISTEAEDGNPGHSGASVLRGQTT